MASVLTVARDLAPQENVIPTLTEGLIEVCKLKPEDPVDYLAEWLFKNNPVEEDHFE